MFKIWSKTNKTTYKRRKSFMCSAISSSPATQTKQQPFPVVPKSTDACKGTTDALTAPISAGTESASTSASQLE